MASVQITFVVIPEKNRLICNYLGILFGVLCLLSGKALVCSYLKIQDCCLMLMQFVTIPLKIESVKTESVPFLSCNKDINGNHKFTDKLNESS